MVKISNSQPIYQSGNFPDHRGDGEWIGLGDYEKPLLVADVAFNLVLEDEVGDDALQLVQVHVHCTLGAQHRLERHQVQPRAVGEDEQSLEQVPVIFYACVK